MRQTGPPQNSNGSPVCFCLLSERYLIDSGVERVCSAALESRAHSVRNLYTEVHLTFALDESHGDLSVRGCYMTLRGIETVREPRLYDVTFQPAPSSEIPSR